MERRHKARRRSVHTDQLVVDEAYTANQINPVSSTRHPYTLRWAEAEAETL